MTDREQRGLQIAAVCRIDKKAENVWSVPSMSGNGRYTVSHAGLYPHCTCPDHEQRACKCKHMWAVEYAAKRETTQNADGSTTVTDTVTIKASKRATYPQNWPAYNEAQTNEQDDFQRLLNDLCAGLVTPPREPGRAGRPPLPLSDAVFSVVFKVYSTFSGRRFISDLRAAHERGYIDRLPHFNSIFNYLENPGLTPILTSLILESSKPLASVESDFAVDSTGFASSRFIKWYDHKYGCVRQDHDWVKAHFVCGVKTNVVTAVEIHDRNASDTPQLPSLLNTTAQNFTVRELSADKAYASVDNFAALDRLDVTPYVAFKSHHTGSAGGLFRKAFHFFCYSRDTFLAHYHKRSNVESTVMMIKTKFGDAVRSKTDVAMKNEVLCKVLCHNIACLISAFYELGIEATFGAAGCTKTPLPAH
jgi:transposase